MSKLEELFQIEDNLARQKALVDYAKSLKVNILKTKKTDGSYSENELAVLIYNAEQSRKDSKFQVIALFSVAVFILLAVGGGIVLLKIVTSGQGWDVSR